MKYYYYVNNNKGMSSSGSFTSDKTRWIIFEESEKIYLESVERKPYSATKKGIFVEVTK
jgi:hypothetical protein